MSDWKKMPRPKKDDLLSVPVDDIAKMLFGRSRKDALGEGVCVCCGQPARGFRDALSEQEYRISGLCQQCQDKTFGQ